jgi:hypothetical protein
MNKKAAIFKQFKKEDKRSTPAPQGLLLDLKT